MEVPVSPQALEWVRELIGSWQIIGVRWIGTESTTLHAIEVASGTGANQLVLRRYTDAEALASDPWYSPANEVAALELLANTDLPTPELIGADLTGERCGSPTLLTSFLPGAQRKLPDDLEELERRCGLWAEAAATFHAIVVPHGALQPYAPYVPPSQMRPPLGAHDVDMWERAIERLRGVGAPATASFIHRDYHPWNTLWLDGHLTGIVDWPTASAGPPQIDTAHMRVNLAMNATLEAADTYRRAADALGAAHDPIWDLMDAVDMAQGWIDEPPETAGEQAEIHRLETFTEAALSELE